MLREQLSAYGAAAAVALVVTGPQGRVLGGYGRPGRHRAGPLALLPDDGVNLCLREEHGQGPGRGQGPVAGLAAERAGGPHGIDGRPAADPSAVVPDVRADRHAVSVRQCQRPGRDLLALGRVALLVQELQIPAAMRSAVNPGDDVIDRGAARRVRQAVPAPRAAPVLQLHQLGHERQAVRSPRHNLVVILAITSRGAERPAAEPLPGRHWQPAHTAPARLRRHQAKLTGRSDITAVRYREMAGRRRP